MNSPKELAQIFLKNQEIFGKAKIILDLKEVMQKKLESYQQLHWTISETRNFLTEKLLAQEQFKAMPSAIYKKAKEKIQEHLDIYFPISIADYRQESGWEDTRLLLDYFCERPDACNFINMWNFDKSVYESKVDYDNKVANNHTIIQNQPFQLDEFKNLEKRIIYAQCGGIANITDINVISHTFTIQGQAFEEKFLEINIDKPVKYKNVIYSRSNIRLSDENDTYKLKLENMESIIWSCGSNPGLSYSQYTEVIDFIENKVKDKKICLIWIKNTDAILPDINNFIEQFKFDKINLENNGLRNIIAKEFKNINGLEFYTNFRDDIHELFDIQDGIRRCVREIESIFMKFDEFRRTTARQYWEIESELFEQIIYYSKISILDDQLQSLTKLKNSLINDLVNLNKKNQKTKLVLKTEVSYKNEESNSIVTKINNIVMEQKLILKKLELITKVMDQEKYILVKKQQDQLKEIKYVVE